MADVVRTIWKVELFVQCLGAPETWLGPSAPLGFPGINLPADDLLGMCRKGMVNKTMTVPYVDSNSSPADKDAYAHVCAEALGALFLNATSTAAAVTGYPDAQAPSVQRA